MRMSKSMREVCSCLRVFVLLALAFDSKAWSSARRTMEGSGMVQSAQRAVKQYVHVPAEFKTLTRTWEQICIMWAKADPRQRRMIMLVGVPLVLLWNLGGRVPLIYYKVVLASILPAVSAFLLARLVVRLFCWLTTAYLGIRDWGLRFTREARALTRHLTLPTAVILLARIFARLMLEVVTAVLGKLFKGSDCAAAALIPARLALKLLWASGMWGPLIHAPNQGGRKRSRRCFYRAVMYIIKDELLKLARTPFPSDYLFACLAWFPAVQASILIIKRRSLRGVHLPPAIAYPLAAWERSIKAAKGTPMGWLVTAVLAF